MGQTARTKQTAPARIKRRGLFCMRRLGKALVGNAGLWPWLAVAFGFEFPMNKV